MNELTLTLDQAIEAAAAHHRAGRTAEAEWLYRAVLRGHPDHPDANHLLGVIAHHSGRLDLAVILIGKAIAVQDGIAAFHSNLGVVFQDQGKLDHAMASYRRALVLKPDFPEALCNLGNALKEQGRLDEAIACCQQALALRPDFPEAFSNLGNPLCELGRLEQAAASCKLALALRPGFAQAAFNLGNILRAQGRPDRAIVCYRRAVGMVPDYAEALSNFGITVQEQGRFDEAVDLYRRALALRPNYPEAQCNLGILWMELGRLMAASQAIERAVDLAPRRAFFYRNLTQAKRLLPGDRWLSGMEDLERDLALLDGKEQVELHFALAKAYEDVGRPADSFHHLLVGNGLKRRQHPYAEAAVLELFERTRSTFTFDLIQGASGLGQPSDVPVFILGMPRSGTSLIEQILASHPQVFGAGERKEFGQLAAGLGGPDDSGFPERAASFDAAEWRRLGTSYLAQIRPLAPQALRITDKMPENFRFAGLIHLVLPNARLIHCRRDPVDTCLSCFSKLFEGDLPWAYDLAEMGRYYRAYERLMEHWRAVLPPGVMLDVEYEEVVADLEGQARRLVAHCGLDWDDSCLTFHHSRRPVRTASATQVRQPIYKTSVGRWQPEASLLRPLLEGLGV